MTASRLLALLAALALPASAQAQTLPQGGQAVIGSATETYAPGKLTTEQHSQHLLMEYDRLESGAGTHWDIQQPNSAAAMIARTRQTDPSVFDGRVTANGNVAILNPNGVMFGPNSTVDVNGLLATTGEIDESEFLNGRYVIDGVGANPDAAVVNRGRITIREGGWAALVAPRVENQGSITARLGRVALSSGDAVTVDPRGDGLIQFRAPLARAPDGAAALVTNTGTIRVEGGTVELSADAMEGVIENVVNADGVISASSATVRGGTVVLSGGRSGVVQVQGDIDARSERAGDTGGRVVVSGKLIDVKSTATVDASGAAGGGDIQIGGDLQGAQTVVQGEAKENADAVRIADGTRILANALDVGDGGRVIVWSEGTTAFAADIEARGGDNGGDGGFVEVSGKDFLAYVGLADVRAPLGDLGTVLLDPTDITISNAPTSNFDLATFLVDPPTSLTSNINIAQLLTQLG
ncbi:MAG: filamentous hemagglutinin N-terminal domain-containing protein, partial [Pseudomonadota bacterium]